MKNLILISFLFLMTIMHGQIVNIPDANFKAKLLAASPTNQVAQDLSGSWFKIDTNDNGEIELSEAIQVKNLFVASSNISSLEGIENFTNVEWLECGFNQISNLNLSALSGLEWLRCNNNLISDLNISGLNNLYKLYCQNNQILSLDLQGMSFLNEIDCSNNILSTLDIQDLPNGLILNCSNNQLFSLNRTSVNSITIFNCSNNLLNNLDLSNLDSSEVNCSNNQLTSINLFNASLTVLYCNNNLLTTIDLSSTSNWMSLNCSNNQLVTIFAKNGFSDYIVFEDNPTLQYICCDFFEIQTIQSLIDFYGYNSICNINSYCSFTPGGTFYVIEGNSKFDINNNGCDIADPNLAHMKFNISDGNVSGGILANGNGNHFIAVQGGQHTLTPQFENPNYFTVTPTNLVVNFPAASSPFNQNFCVSPNGTINDLEIVIAPTIPARPGFDAQYQLVFKNKGNQLANGQVTLTFDQTLLTFLNASQTPTITTGLLTFDYTNLMPFENRAIVLNFNVNSPQNTPPVNIDDELPFSATINPVIGDNIPDDNVFQFKQVVVGAYDPNDITCLQGDVVSPDYIGEYLHYLIRFENTGNFPAEFVVVETFVNEDDYDLSTLQILNASHDMYTRITNNRVEFIFDDINLEPSVSGGGHGNIIIKIKTKDNLMVDDLVSKNANIYFDYNFPILTNDAETVFQALSVDTTLKPSDINVYPNPVHDVLNINTKSNIERVELYDINGRLLLTHINNNSLETTINMSKYSSGTYFVKVFTAEGSGVQKVMKK